MTCANPQLEFCLSGSGGFKVLYDEDGQTEHWVHSECDRPSEAHWQEWRRRCPSCREWYSSPLERKCKKCSESEPFMSWSQLVKQSAMVWNPAVRFRT